MIEVVATVARRGWNAAFNHADEILPSVDNSSKVIEFRTYDTLCMINSQSLC